MRATKAAGDKGCRHATQLHVLTASLDGAHYSAIWCCDCGALGTQRSGSRMKWEHPRGWRKPATRR